MNRNPRKLHEGQRASAFPRVRARLRDSLATFDSSEAGWERPITRCDVSRCHGMCCYDGGFVAPDEVDVLSALLQSRREDFRELGIDVPAEPFVSSRWDTPGVQTAIVDREYPPGADLPPHFRETACFLLTARGTCALQEIAAADGKHRWYYKPLGCWLHPILDRTTEPCFSIFDDATDPFISPSYAGFVSFTQCGRTCASGRPAREVLTAELGYVRDLVGEDALPADLRDWITED